MFTVLNKLLSRKKKIVSRIQVLHIGRYIYMLHLFMSIVLRLRYRSKYRIFLVLKMLINSVLLILARLLKVFGIRIPKFLYIILFFIVIVRFDTEKEQVYKFINSIMPKARVKTLLLKKKLQSFKRPLLVKLPEIIYKIIITNNKWVEKKFPYIVF